MREGQVIEAALKLAKALDKAADSQLPEKLAGIVKVHSGIAVGSAFIPIPFVDFAATTANIWAMYVRINKELSLPFGKHLMKSIVAGIVTNIGGAVLGTLAIGIALKFIPGLGSLGGAAIMAATVYGITILSGIVYMRAVAMVIGKKSSLSITEAELKSAAESVMEDRAAMKDMVNDLRKTFKTDKN